ncbi:unnamed protein product, partial [Nesidiocoris tenuis]
SIVCDKQPLLDPICSLPSSGMDKIIRQCHKLPYEDIFKVYINDSALVSQEKGSLKLTLDCYKDVINSTEDCGGIRQIVVGTRDSPNGLHLIIRPNINSTTGAWIGKPLCQKTKMTIPCSSPPVAVPMSRMENCNIRREIDHTQEAEFHTYDSYQPSHPLDSHPDAMSPEEALWTLIRSVHMKVIDRKGLTEQRFGAEDFTQEMEAFKKLGVYQGFNPEETMKRLATANLEYAGRGGGLSLTAQEPGSGAQPLVLKINAKLSTDIRLLLIFAMRETDYEKLTQKSKAEFVIVVTLLYQKYSIRRTIPAPGDKRSLAPDVVTLPRIAAVAPHILTNLYAALAFRPIPEVVPGMPCRPRGDGRN